MPQQRPIGHGVWKKGLTNFLTQDGSYPTGSSAVVTTEPVTVDAAAPGAGNNVIWVDKPDAAQWVDTIVIGTDAADETVQLLIAGASKIVGTADSWLKHPIMTWDYTLGTLTYATSVLIADTVAVDGGNVVWDGTAALDRYAFISPADNTIAIASTYVGTVQKVGFYMQDGAGTGAETSNVVYRWSNLNL